MMFTGIATVQRRRIAALASALVLAVLLAGNVAAAPLSRDNGGNGALVSPRLNPPAVWKDWMRLKLMTRAGYKVLVYG